MRLNSLILLLLLIALSNQVVFAGPGNPSPIKYTQPDKSTIMLKLFGDEWYNYVETVDGYTVIKNENDFWVYTQKNSAGELIASNVVAHLQAERSVQELKFLANVEKHLQPNKEIISKLQLKNPYHFSNYKKSAKLVKNFQSEDKEIWRIPVLLVEFPDLTHRETVQSFDDMFHEDGWDGGIGSKGSFNDYFREISYSKFEVVADILGWFTAPNGYRYYSWSHSDKWDRAQQFTAAAVDSAEAAGVDFSVYDNDGDGIVEQVIVVHAGHASSSSADLTYIWPHKYVLLEHKKYYDGVEINEYTMQPELQFGRHAGIGMYAHEFGHALGLPDLYDYDFSSEGVGDWCEMARCAWLDNGRTPCHFCAWAKEEVGWINPILIEESGAYSFHEVETKDSTIYKMDIPTVQSEYFLVENRQQIGFDTYLPSNGILIWHIDMSRTHNDDETHKLVDLEEADGLDQLDKSSKGDSGDPYPGKYNNRVFDSNSYPNSLDYNGDYSVVSISNISDSDLIMTADVNIDGVAFFSSDLTTGDAPVTI